MTLLLDTNSRHDITAGAAAYRAKSRRSSASSTNLPQHLPDYRVVAAATVLAGPPTPPSPPSGTLETLTPPELLTHALPPFRRPQYHPPAAPRTLPRGRPGSTQPQVPNMLPISTPRLLHPPRLDHCTNFRDLPLRQRRRRERAYVPSPVETHRHILWHFPLQLCLTHEHDHRPDHSSRQRDPFQRILYRHHMPVVLPKRILELVPPPTRKYLRPLPIPLTPENPPRHVLRFHDEHPKHRNNHVIDLSRPANRP